MNPENPIRFSVVMPVYNQEKYVGQALDSVLNQSFTDFETLVIDDGSTDNSLQVIERYQPRIKLIRQENQGPEVARNNAAAQAIGEYLVFLDSDDVFFPFALETLDRVIRNFDSPPLILANLLFFEDRVPDPPSRPVEVFKYKDYLSRTRPLGSANRAANLTDSIVVKRSVFYEVGGMRNSDPQTFHNEDAHLLLKLGNYSPCLVINEPGITAYRRHDMKSTRNIQAIADGWLRLARAERSGEYKGRNRWARYATIGGRSLQWAYRYCWRSGKRKLAMKLFTETCPMIAVALIDKVFRRFKKTAPPIILPDNA
jgi:glycosyltransferase involved in cell wall biosynthesis